MAGEEPGPYKKTGTDELYGRRWYLPVKRNALSQEASQSNYKRQPLSYGIPHPDRQRRRIWAPVKSRFTGALFEVALRPWG